MEQEKYLKLRKHLILSDHGLGRLYDMFRKKYRLITFAHGVLLPIVFFAMLYVKQSGQFIIHSPFLYFMKIGMWTLIYMGVLWTIFPLIINKIIDKHTMHRMEEDIDDKEEILSMNQEYIKSFSRLFDAVDSFSLGEYIKLTLTPWERLL